MRKASILVVSVIGSLLFASSALAQAGDAEKCLRSAIGSRWIGGQCFCPKDFQPKGGICEPAICKEERPEPPRPHKAPAQPRGKGAPEEAPPACVSTSGDRIRANSPNEEISLEFTCDPGNRPLTMVGGECIDCEVADRSGRVFSGSSNRKAKSKKKGPITEVFKVRRPAGTNETELAARLVVTSTGKDMSSTPTGVAVIWPAKKPPVTPPPPPVVKSPAEIACERDGGKFDPKTEKCDCPVGTVPEVWTDPSGNLHLCKVKPVVIKGEPGAPGVTKTIKETVFKGDQGHFLLELSLLGIGVDGKLATGGVFTFGYSLGFAQPVSKWHLTVRGSAIILPIARYDSAGGIAHDSAGKPVKDNWGFAASAVVSYTFHPMFRLGLGPEYMELGYHNAGRTAEFIGGRLDLALMPYRGEYATMEIFLSPQFGRFVGGPVREGELTAGAELGIGFFF